DDVVSFHHALVQDVAYARVLRRHRVELHRRVADVAEALYGSGDDVIELLARHRYLGGGGPRAVAALERAGDRAARLFANDEAIVHFERAVELCRKDDALADRLPETLLRLADLHELRGEFVTAHDLYAESARSHPSVGAW